MIKSLEKLRSRDFAESVRDVSNALGNIVDVLIDIADEIKDEIDRYYLPRPLYEDGDPVQIGDMIYNEHSPNDQHCELRDIRYFSDFITLSSKFGNGQVINYGERVKRPPEPDTQKKINDDALRLSVVGVNDGKGNLYNKILDLLKRQRKLDGVDE